MRDKIKVLFYIMTCSFLNNSCQKLVSIFDVRDKTQEQSTLLLSGEAYVQKCDYKPYQQKLFSLVGIQNRKKKLNDLEKKLKLPKGFNLQSAADFYPNEKERYSYQTDGITHLTYLFTYKKRPICRNFVKAHYKGEKLLFYDKLPAWLNSKLKISAKSHSDFDLKLLEKIFNKEENRKFGKEISVYRSEPCWFFNKEDNLLRPSGEIYFINNNNVPWKAITYNEKIVDEVKLLFNLIESSLPKGSFQVYKENKVKDKGKVSVIEVTEMQKNGFLCSEWVSTKISGGKVPNKKDFKFFYDQKSKDFSFSSAFVHLSKIYDWYRSLSSNPQDFSQIDLVLSSYTKRKLLGPAYLQPSFNSQVHRPTIILPDVMQNNSEKLKAKEYRLHNLYTDFDAVGHELGHYILFKVLEIGKETVHRAINEAIPDFFVAAYTKDPCLGESLCTENHNNLCATDKCLRDADNNYTKTSIEYRMYCGKSYHRCAQVLTGILWALGKKKNLGLEKTALLLFKALPFLPRQNVKFFDVFKSMVEADSIHFEGKYKNDILTVLKERKFTSIASRLE